MVSPCRSWPIRVHPRARAVAGLVCATVLLGAGALPAAESLEQVWTHLVGKKGILEEKSCGYVLTLSSTTQSGNAVVQAVHGDHVVLIVERDQKKLEYVIPLGQITLRTTPG